MTKRVAGTVLATALVAVLAGCASKEPATGEAGGTPAPEHPSGAEHPKADHPKADHPKSEHPQGEHPKADHPK